MTSPPGANLFVVGAAKAGTTSLCVLLGRHSQIFLPATKEPHHFMFPADGSASGKFVGVASARMPLEESSYLKNRADYLALFAPGADRKYRLDGSTQYLASPDAARAIHRAVPNAKIVIQIREPLARAWSAYTYARSKGEENKEFSAALEEEYSGARDNRFYSGYLEGSNYAHQIALFRNLFGPGDVHISFFEDFTADPKRVLDTIFGFLDIAAEDVVGPSGVVGNPTLVTPNPILRAARKLGARMRHHRLAQTRAAHAVHQWILRRSDRPEWSLSDEDRAKYEEMLESQTGYAPITTELSEVPSSYVR